MERCDQLWCCCSPARPIWGGDPICPRHPGSRRSKVRFVPFLAEPKTTHAPLLLLFPIAIAMLDRDGSPGREVIRRLEAASSTGISPSRGSHVTAPIACDGSAIAKRREPPTVAGQEYHCPRCWSLPRRVPLGVYSSWVSLSASDRSWRSR